jgi:hypothetical protein
LSTTKLTIVKLWQRRWLLVSALAAVVAVCAMCFLFWRLAPSTTEWRSEHKQDGYRAAIKSISWKQSDCISAELVVDDRRSDKKDGSGWVAGDEVSVRYFFWDVTGQAIDGYDSELSSYTLDFPKRYPGLAGRLGMRAPRTLLVTREIYVPKMAELLAVRYEFGTIELRGNQTYVQEHVIMTNPVPLPPRRH